MMMMIIIFRKQFRNIPGHSDNTCATYLGNAERKYSKEPHWTTNTYFGESTNARV
jgi:hypothetical protein